MVFLCFSSAFLSSPWFLELLEVVLELLELVLSLSLSYLSVFLVSAVGVSRRTSEINGSFKIFRIFHRDPIFLTPQSDPACNSTSTFFLNVSVAPQWS